MFKRNAFIARANGRLKTNVTQQSVRRHCSPSDARCMLAMGLTMKLIREVSQVVAGRNKSLQSVLAL